MEWIPLQSLPTPGFQTSGLRNCERSISIILRPQFVALCDSSHRNLLWQSGESSGALDKKFLKNVVFFFFFYMNVDSSFTHSKHSWKRPSVYQLVDE